MMTPAAMPVMMGTDRTWPGDVMIGPPGLPKFPRRVFSAVTARRRRAPQHHHAWKWAAGLYMAGVLAHFSHHMADLPNGIDPSLGEALTAAPTSFVWPADLKIGRAHV